MGVGAVRKSSDPFAELDAEIKKSEDTQAILNTILDLFLPRAKEPTKDRQGVPGPPKMSCMPLSRPRGAWPVSEGVR